MKFFKPFDELLTNVYLKYDEGKKEASLFVGDVKFTSALLQGDSDKEIKESLTEFKKYAIMQLASASSTIQLMTQCGCTQMIDLPEYRNAVKFKINKKSIISLNEQTHEVEREFLFDGRLTEEGFKLYIEV